MEKFLAVEIEHSKYAKFLKIDKRDKSSLNLTTLVDDQRRAEVHIYLVTGGKKRLIHSFNVTKLPRQKAGQPRLLLTGEADGRKTVTLSLRVNGAPWSSVDIPIKKYLKRGVPPILPIGLGVLLLLLLLLIPLRRCVFSPEETGTPPAQTAQPKETKESEKPKDRAQESNAQERGTQESGDRESKEEQAEEVAKADGRRERIDTAETTEKTAGVAAEGTAGQTAEAPSEGSFEEPAEEEEEIEKGEEKTEGEKEAVILPEKTTVYFEPNSSRLTAAADEKLSSLARELSAILERVPSFEDFRILVRGHCALYGTEQGRVELSNERAEAVVRVLEGRLRERDKRVLSSAISTVGLGGKEPVTRDEERQQLNRRVEVIIERR